MALANNFIPQTSLVFGVRDFAPQIAQQAQNDTKALQNAFKFGTQVYDYMQGRKQANLMEQDSNDRKALEDQIAAIEARKINSKDPTSIWRWKEGINQLKIQRQEDMDRIKAEKEANKELIKRQMLNKVANTLGTIKLGLNTTPEQAQQYRNTLAGLLTEAQNAGIEDLSSIQNTIAQLDDSLPYEQMQDLASQIGLYDKYFDKMNSSEDGYGSEGKYDVYANNLKKIWDTASDEMKRNREFKTLYEEALEKHKKSKQKANPGAPKYGVK